MGLSLLKVISKSNFRLYKPKLLNNYVRQNELKCTRFMSNYLRNSPINTYKNVSY